ncbi:MAG: hypothetical protein WC306_03385 [Candidatus Paceibacterota bacterium]|jgi:hypothetical protein
MSEQKQEQTAEELQAQKDAAAQAEQKKQEELKPVPYERFKEVNAAKIELEKELKTIKDKQEADKKAAEDAKLREEGDYKALMTKVEQERAAEKNKLNGMIANTFKNALAVEHGLIKSEYIDLFKVEVKAEDMEIKNADEVKKAFEVFKKDNPTLFKTEEKKVPKTDDKKFVAPKEKEMSSLSSREKILIGLEKRK